MITFLEEALERADGAYIYPEDLQSLDQSFKTWQMRRQVYQLIQTKEQAIVDQVIAELNQSSREISRRHTQEGTDKCRRDLALVLRYCATAMLLQDETLLKDRLLVWFQNIMRALNKQQFNDRAYRFLQKAVQEQLPSDGAELLMPYLVVAHQWLSQ